MAASLNRRILAGKKRAMGLARKQTGSRNNVLSILG